jgi:hypothetical protein
MKRMKWLVAAAVAGGGLLLAQTGNADDTGFTPLFNGKDLSGWKIVLKDSKADPASAFVVKDGEVQVPGTNYGYFHTDKSFKNYVIRYSWTYPKNQPEKTTMNSGLLIHIQEPHKVWPKCIEPQGQYKNHGKLFFVGFGKDEKKESTFNEAAQKKALKASDEWNTTEVIAKGDGSIEVRINGQLVATGKSDLVSGQIGFQSEGARIHFKDILIKKLD